MVLACCGDIYPLETVAATALVREHPAGPEGAGGGRGGPDAAAARDGAPAWAADAEYGALFRWPAGDLRLPRLRWRSTAGTYRRNGHRNLHVRGYKEEGTTTTPFDMVMMNHLDRFHLVMDVIDRVPGLGEREAHLRQQMVDERLRHREYTREHGDDT